MLGIGSFLFGVIGPWRKKIIENGTRNGLAQCVRKLAELPLCDTTPEATWVHHQTARRFFLAVAGSWLRAAFPDT